MNSLHGLPVAQPAAIPPPHQAKVPKPNRVHCFTVVQGNEDNCRLSKPLSPNFKTLEEAETFQELFKDKFPDCCIHEQGFCYKNAEDYEKAMINIFGDFGMAALTDKLAPIVNKGDKLRLKRDITPKKGDLIACKPFQSHIAAYKDGMDYFAVVVNIQHAGVGSA